MKTSIFLLLAGCAILTSCEPNTDNPNEQEIVTTLRITATEVPVWTPLVFEFNDPDGDGGNAPTIDTLHLAASTTYQVSLELLNESVSPVDTITHEIEEEGTDHQFFFVPAGVSITASYDDQDSNGDPVGLHSTWTTGAASSGTLRLTLKHLDGLPKDGNINTGDTDIQVDFPVSIQ